MEPKTPEDPAIVGPEPCAGCGLRAPGGTQGCQRIMDEMIARDFGNALFFRVHRLLVDTYSLQHPERYCASAKSLAAHLTGLAWLMEYEGNRATGSEALRRWLNGRSDLEKPSIPEFRGALTIADVRDHREPREYADAVDRWARATWEAYVPLHALAREWIHQALAKSEAWRG